MIERLTGIPRISLAPLVIYRVTSCNGQITNTENRLLKRKGALLQEHPLFILLQADGRISPIAGPKG